MESHMAEKLTGKTGRRRNPIRESDAGEATEGWTVAIYVWSLLVGCSPNGVDYAQGYRAGSLRKQPCPVRYVFAELPEMRDIRFYAGLGIRLEEMLSMYHTFLDQPALGLSVKLGDKLADLQRSLGSTDVEYRDAEVRLWKDGRVSAVLLFDQEEPEALRMIHFFHQGKLIRTEHYTDHMAYVDYYVTAQSERGLYAKKTRRAFCHGNGTVAYEQIFEGERSWYLFPDGRALTKSEFFAEFVKRLQLSKEDVVLIDRFAQLDYVQPLFQEKGLDRVIAVMHAGHYFEKGESSYTVNFNQDYNYLFKYSGMLDAIVVSTWQQKEDLEGKLGEYLCAIPDIVVIPAGGVDRLRYPDKERKKGSMLSASRIQLQKRVHWIIGSVIKAHEKNSDISLDIYGEGVPEYRIALQELIEAHHAQSYIRLMGHQDVRELYRNYEVFLTASTFETLGLSILEAISSGLAVIGLEAKYGSRLLVHPGENGYLVKFEPASVNEDEEKLINSMAEKILEMFEEPQRLETFHQNSYRMAEGFSMQAIADKWMEVLQ